MKGISAVIATILLLLIVIAIVGFAFNFFQNIFGATTVATQNQTNQVIRNAAYQVSIDNAAATSVTIRNAGTVNLVVANAPAASDLTFYVGGVTTTCTWGAAATIAPGGTGTCTFAASCSGKLLRITTVGGTESIAQCS